MLDETFFSVKTRLGFTVRVTKGQWERIVTIKHPVMLGCEEDVRTALADPDQIRESFTDPTVLLFYRLEEEKRWLCAVTKRVDNLDGFLITAYPTDAIKEGKSLWNR